MDGYLGLKWVEWFSLAMLVFTVGAPVGFLIYSYMRHHLDDPDCSKYDAFLADPTLKPGEAPSMPAACQPKHLRGRSWTDNVNIAWIWATLAIGLVWVVLMVGTFVLSRLYPPLQESVPM